MGPVFFEVMNDVQSGAIGEPQSDDEEIGRMSIDGVQCLIDGGGPAGELELGLAVEDGLQSEVDDGLIVDDEDGSGELPIDPGVRGHDCGLQLTIRGRGMFWQPWVDLGRILKSGGALYHISGQSGMDLCFCRGFWGSGVFLGGGRGGP